MMTDELIAEYETRIAGSLQRVEVLGALPSDAKHQELLRALVYTNLLLIDVHRKAQADE